MAFEQIKKNARAFLTSRTPDPATPVKTSRLPAAARVSPMSSAQKKVYGSLTADRGFSVEDARRQFLSAGKDQKRKTER
jgi:hypothetical protein